jgi:hypothetical protein
MRKTFEFDLAVPSGEGLRIAEEAAAAVASWRKDPGRSRTWKFGSHLGLRGAGRVELKAEAAPQGRSRISLSVRRWGLVDIFGLLPREARLWLEQITPRVTAAVGAIGAAGPAIVPEQIPKPRIGLRVLALLGVILGIGVILSLVMVLNGEDGDSGVVTVGTSADADEPGCELEIAGAGISDETGVVLPVVTGCDSVGQPLTVPVPGAATIVWMAAAWDPHSEIQAGAVRQWLDQSGSAAVPILIVSDLARAEEGLPPWAAEAFPGMRTLVVEDTEVADSFGTVAYPEWLLVDERGVLTERVKGRLELAELAVLLDG